MGKPKLKVRLREGQYEYTSQVTYPSSEARVSLMGTGGTRSKAFDNLLFSMTDEKIWDFSDKLRECINVDPAEGEEEKDGNNVYYFFIVELNCTHEEFKEITKDDYDIDIVNNFFNPLLMAMVNLEETIQVLIKSNKPK